MIYYFLPNFQLFLNEKEVLFLDKYSAQDINISALLTHFKLETSQESNNFDVLFQLENACEKIFNSSIPKMGKNINGEFIVRGVKITSYNNKNSIFEPILYNLNLEKENIDWGLKNLNEQEAQDYINHYYNSGLYRNPVNISYLFHDGKEFHFFLFTPEYPYNPGNRKNFINDLEFRMFIQPFREKLEQSLILSDNPKKRLKI